MMELVLALAIGVLSASGVWLLLRPRTFQVIMGLSLLSYAVNIFIFAMGRLRSGAPPVLAGDVSDPARYTDPTPQALVLSREPTANVERYDGLRVQNAGGRHAS